MWDYEKREETMYRHGGSSTPPSGFVLGAGYGPVQGYHSGTVNGLTTSHSSILGYVHGPCD